MERLTQRLRTGEVLMASKYEEKYTEQEWISVLQDRLAAYEDTGLTPQEVISMHGEWCAMMSALNSIGGGYTRLRELAEADKDGRLVVLPCKVGDTVYWVHGAVITECKVHRIQKNRNGLYICLKSKKSHGAFRTDLCFGKSIFLTREEAEKALEAKSND